MSEEQLKALLAKLQEDVGLREQIQGADDIEAAVALANKAGFSVSKEDWSGRRELLALQLSDEELERASGGIHSYANNWCEQWTNSAKQNCMNYNCEDGTNKKEWCPDWNG